MHWEMTGRTYISVHISFKKSNILRPSQDKWFHCQYLWISLWSWLWYIRPCNIVLEQSEENTLNFFNATLMFKNKFDLIEAQLRALMISGDEITINSLFFVMLNCLFVKSHVRMTQFKWNGPLHIENHASKHYPSKVRIILLKWKFRKPS